MPTLRSLRDSAALRGPTAPPFSQDLVLAAVGIYVRDSATDPLTFAGAIGFFGAIAH